MLQAQTGLQEHLQPVPLPVERVDDICAWLDKGRFEHVRQEGQDRVERLELCVGIDIGLSVGDTGEKLGEDGEIEDEGSGEEGVFALVEDVLESAFVYRECRLVSGRHLAYHDVSSSHKQLRVVLINRSFCLSVVLVTRGIHYTHWSRPQPGHA